MSGKSEYKKRCQKQNRLRRIAEYDLSTWQKVTDYKYYKSIDGLGVMWLPASKKCIILGKPHRVLEERHIFNLVQNINHAERQKESA